MLDAAGSMDPLQDAVGPLSQAAGTSRETYLIRGRKSCVTSVKQIAEKNVREMALQTPRPEKKKEGGEVLKVPEQSFPCSPWRTPW